MLKKTSTPTSQIVTKTDRTSSIPQDFEPVSRRKQDEEKDEMYQHAGDKQNAQFAAQRFDDDEENADDAYHVKEEEALEDVLREVV